MFKARSKDLEKKGEALTDLVISSTLHAAKQQKQMHWTYNDVLGANIPRKDPSHETAISRGFRNAIFEVVVGTGWDEISEDEAMISHTMPVANQLYALGLGSNMSYYNEVVSWKNQSGHMYNELKDWKHRFWGEETYNFLKRVKSKYDPCNILWVDRGVASDEPKLAC